MRESIVANAKYGISVQLQRKTTGNPIQGRRLYDPDFNRKELNLKPERFQQRDIRWEWA
jgi:hypothetical protein